MATIPNRSEHNHPTRTRILSMSLRPPTPRLKPIHFEYLLDSVDGPRRVNAKPGEYDNVALIGRDDEDTFDLMVAWDDDRFERMIYLGYWYDGVVETVDDAKEVISDGNDSE